MIKRQTKTFRAEIMDREKVGGGGAKRETDRQTERHKGKLTDTYSERCTERHAHMQTDWQAQKDFSINAIRQRHPFLQ